MGYVIAALVALYIAVSFYFGFEDAKIKKTFEVACEKEGGKLYKLEIKNSSMCVVGKASEK